MVVTSGSHSKSVLRSEFRLYGSGFTNEATMSFGRYGWNSPGRPGGTQVRAVGLCVEKIFINRLSPIFQGES